jgi:phosphatidylserine decarboxylase
MLLITFDIFLLLLIINILGNFGYFGAIITLLILLFFRIPNLSKLEKFPNKITSPADGKILKITGNGNRTIVSIFLSILDRHIQVTPIDGKIVKIKYKKGEFHPAYMFEKSKFNERMEIFIKTRIGIVKVTNFAGLLVRRIQKFKNVNDNVKQHDLLSIIKFGSRVDVSFPNEMVTLLVKENDHLKIGQPIANYIF